MDKIDKLLDAIEYPERYSDAEIEAMLADPEVKEVYGLLYKTKSSIMPISTPNADAEWKEFESAHCKRSFRILNLFSRNVAASMIIGIATLAAVASVVGVSVHYVLDKKEESHAAEFFAVAKDDAVKNDAETIAEEIPVKKAETIIFIFDNEPLENIVNRIAEYYGYKAEFSTDSSMSLRLYFRWNQELTIDEVIESLNNFEQIRITVKGKTIKID